MDIDALKTTLEQASLASIAIGFAAGFLFSFNPVALASIPVSLAYVTKVHETKRAVLYGAMFILGMIATQVLLGLIAGLGGAWVQSLLGRQWGLVLGPLLFVLGLVWAGSLNLPIPRIPLRAKRAANIWGAFILGAAFSVAVCPVWLGAVAVGWLENLHGLSRSQRAFDMVAGVVLMLMGLYMLNVYFWVPELAAQAYQNLPWAKADARVHLAYSGCTGPRPSPHVLQVRADRSLLRIATIRLARDSA